jgi:hypothetical protein
VEKVEEVEVYEVELVYDYFFQHLRSLKLKFNFPKIWEQIGVVRNTLDATQET